MKQEILNGNLGLPSYQKFREHIGEYTYLADKFWQALWNAYLLNKGSISLPYWYDKFDNPAVFNQVLIALARGNWIVTHSIPARNWAEASINEDKLLQFVTQDQLEQVRAHNKFKQYRLQRAESTKVTSTRINGRTMDTGISRPGFCLAGNTEFSYDTAMMDNYYDILASNLTKSMDKIAQQCPNLRHDSASYDTISLDILDWHIANPDMVFTRGSSYNDSRGRAISSSLSKVANPISNKDFRALLVIE